MYPQSSVSRPRCFVPEGRGPSVVHALQFLDAGSAQIVCLVGGISFPGTDRRRLGARRAPLLDVRKRVERYRAPAGAIAGLRIHRQAGIGRRPAKQPGLGVADGEALHHAVGIEECRFQIDLGKFWLTVGT